jgi:hypothetical protein
METNPGAQDPNCHAHRPNIKVQCHPHWWVGKKSKKEERKKHIESESADVRPRDIERDKGDVGQQ